jgi:class 3 adenylate cyclase
VARTTSDERQRCSTLISPTARWSSKIGIHTGAAIAATLNERLDTFGQNVNIAARIQGVAEAGEICISQDVHADKEAAALLATLPVQSSQSKLRGMREDFRVFRIGSETSPLAPAAAE